jgi:spermidine/putrescine transport system substrate-binding protein
MRRFLLALTVLVVAGAAGCGRQAPRVLHVYTWADYIKPELVTRFEQEQKCKIVIDTFDSNEAMYAKLKAGASGYDIVTPSSYQVSVMEQQGLLQPLDHAKIPNIKNVDPAWLKVALDPEMHYSVPYMTTLTGLAYLGSKVLNPEPSWAMFDRPDLKGRTTLLNDMRETIGAALKFLGYSLNTTDEAQLAQARDVVIRWKHNAAKFENEQYKGGLASGEFLLVHGYGGDLLQARADNPDVKFAAPREGISVSCDELVIPKDAKEVALAYRFINFLHDPDVAAENSIAVTYLCPNVPSYDKLPEDFRNDPAIRLDAAVMAKSEVIKDLGADNAKYTQIWDAIKAAP